LPDQAAIDKQRAFQRAGFSVELQARLGGGGFDTPALPGLCFQAPPSRRLAARSTAAVALRGAGWPNVG
jgi:hypothetical protein